MTSLGVGRSNRGYIEIIYSVLEASMDSALKTHIMFKCNLNSRQVQLYVEFLVHRGLLSRGRLPSSPKVGYTTTELGRRYMRAYETLLGLVGTQQLSPVHVKA